ncbi:helix-turn-helix transcriptional regulator [Achromobacter xylosoxidans]|uniref:helix-turn-helix domain-containing protein n=1 Tax=Alcaligenes xylosoxydans xylosoxydans TaxID=85698 RepID=UPI000970E7DF|nr:helix-turn-helix domain-containing protein [Achromobacter xylosoxidans]OMG90930.1 helix-turn-helix transcriptional regulator [Achromobacter xylosoxidans]
MSAKPASAIPRAPAPVRLSPRESASLHWSAIGKTSWETARILDISESTVNFHLRNACRKLQVRGRRAAVATAIRRGLLNTVTV